MARKRRFLERADGRLAGVSLTLLRRCWTAAVDPKPSSAVLDLNGSEGWIPVLRIWRPVMSIWLKSGRSSPWGPCPRTGAGWHGKDRGIGLEDGPWRHRAAIRPRVLSMAVPRAIHSSQIDDPEVPIRPLGFLANPRVKLPLLSCRALRQGPRHALGRFDLRSRFRRVHCHQHRDGKHRCGPASAPAPQDAKGG